MDITDPHFALAVHQIVWIDLLLSGDDAGAVALACRALPENQKRTGILLGAGTGSLLRSIPLVVLGATLIAALLARFPRVVRAGAPLPGWTAGGMIATDPFVAERVAHLPHGAAIGVCIAAILVVGTALLLSWRRGVIVQA